MLNSPEQFLHIDPEIEVKRTVLFETPWRVTDLVNVSTGEDQRVVICGPEGLVFDPESAVVYSRFSIPWGYFRFEPAFIQDEPVLMSTGDGFSALYVTDLEGRLRWEYPKKNGVGVAATMVSGDLDLDGTSELYVARSRGLNRPRVDVLNENGNLVNRIGTPGRLMYTIAVSGPTLVATAGAQIEFFSAKGELLKVRENPAKSLSHLYGADWPGPGDLIGLGESGRSYYLYIMDSDARVKFRKRLGLSGIYVAVIEPREGKRVLAVLHRHRSGSGVSDIYIFDSDFNEIYRERIVGEMTTHAICSLVGGSFLVGQGNLVIRYDVTLRY